MSEISNLTGFLISPKGAFALCITQGLHKSMPCSSGESVHSSGTVGYYSKCAKQAKHRKCHSLLGRTYWNSGFVKGEQVIAK